MLQVATTTALCERAFKETIKKDKDMKMQQPEECHKGIGINEHAKTNRYELLINTPVDNFSNKLIFIRI